MERGSSRKSECLPGGALGLGARTDRGVLLSDQPHLLARRQRSTRPHLDLITRTRDTNLSTFNILPPYHCCTYSTLGLTTNFNHLPNDITYADRKIRQIFHALLILVEPRIPANVPLGSSFCFLYLYFFSSLFLTLSLLTLGSWSACDCNACM
jgi:hypothetical protein